MDYARTSVGDLSAEDIGHVLFFAFLVQNLEIVFL